MPHARLKSGRLLLVAGLVAVALAGCGRKGPLEPPPAAANAIDLPDDQIGATEVAVPNPVNTSPVARPSTATRAITVPERDFFLDPLL